MVGPRRPRARLGRPPKEEAGPTRELLLDAALRLFAERGFAATTVRQIAREVGVTDAAIYFHFSSKQAIFDALMAEAGPPLLLSQGVALTSLGKQNPAEAIPLLFQRLVDAWDRPRVRQFTSVMLRHSPDRLGEVMSEVEARLLPVMQTWARGGSVRDDVSPELLVWELLAPLATIRLTLLHGGAGEVERKRARDLARQHLAFYVRMHVGAA